MQIDDLYLDYSYELAGQVIHPVAGTVDRGDESGSLTRKQLEVLALLASAQGQMVPRDAFIEQVWDGNRLTGERGLTDTIYALRRSLKSPGSKGPLIRTIPRRGYQLEAEARSIREDRNPSFAGGWSVPGRSGWELERLLSRNDDTETWLVRQSESQEERIFRFCHKEAHRRRLSREIHVLRFLRDTLAQGRNVTTLLDWWLQEPPYYLELEPTAHGSSQDWAAGRGGLPHIPLAERLRLMANAAVALAAVHSVGVVHRNLSPQSLLVDEDEGQLIAKLGDFGLGNLVRAADLTSSGSDCAPVYLAPEYQGGPGASPASDVYALGVVIYQVIHGDWQRSPESGWAEEVGTPALRELVDACLEDRPEQRPSAAELAERLEALDADGSEIRPDSEQRATPPKRFTRAPGGSPQRRPVGTKRTGRDRVGQSIGPFHLLDLLGEGGMGTVYLAEQREPVERQVALKLVKSGMDSEQVLARFEAERQALALMDHANVATVFDVGCTDSGYPYFAMEYVPGLEITAHCDRSKLKIRERIELFLQVCQGVQHAHQKGLIHRDLKPNNILVKSPMGQSATVKIIDFGVAKSLQQKLSVHPVHTRLGTFVGTPSYSSPEQISDFYQDVDTRADVYSLGIVLYELLVGVTPYDVDDLAGKAPKELKKFLDGTEPPTPRARFSSLQPTEGETIARNRSETLERLEQRLNDDLSWIILRCLERDPDDRYPSVSELEKDLRRWLANEPIEARPSTWLYRSRKFVRRHWVAVATTTLVTLLLVSATTLAVLGFLRAEREAAKARTAALEAESAAEFQVRQVQSIDPASMAIGLRAQLQEHVLRELAKDGASPESIEDSERQLQRLLQGVNFTDLALDQLGTYYFDPALRAIEADYEDFPLLQARLWQAMAETLLELGDLERAIAPQERALETRRALLGAEHPLTLSSLRGRGRLRLALGQFEEAEADLRTVAKSREQILGDDDPETWTSIDELGLLFQEQGQLDEAERYYQRALEGRRRVLGDYHPDTLRSINHLGGLFWQREELEEAEAHHQEALDGRRQILGEDHLATLESINDLGALHWKRGQLDQAEKLYSEALAGYRRLLGDEHPNSQVTLNNLAALLQRAERFEDAEALYREGLEVRRRLLGDRHPSTLRSMANLGTVLSAQGELEEAEGFYREALQGRRQVLGNEHPSTLSSINNLAIILRDRRQLGKAEVLLEEALEGRRRALGDEHPSTLRSLHDLGTVLLQQGRLREAEQALSKALEAQRQVLGDEHPDTLRSVGDLGSVLHAQGQLGPAEAHYRKALEAQRRVVGENHRDTLATVEKLAELVRERG